MSSGGEGPVLTTLMNRQLREGAEAREEGTAVREHWVLDLADREGESRIRVANASHRLSMLQRLALNLLRCGKR